MMLAPQPHLHGSLLTIAPGMAGIRQTLDCMRALVRAFRTHPDVRQTATTLLMITPQRDQLAEVDAVFSWVRDHVRYVRDVVEVETLMTPDKTLQSRLGDCDDQATLLAAMLESVGYPTRFVAAGYSDRNNVDHVYVQVFAEGEWINLDPTEPQELGWAPPDPRAMIIEGVN